MSAQRMLKTAPALPYTETTSKSTLHEMSWWMPLFFFVLGWFTYLLRSNAAFVIGTGIATALLIRLIYLIVVKCKDVRFTWVLACGLILGYGFGSFNTAMQLAKKHQSMSEHFMRLQDELSLAISLVFWISATLLLVGAFVEKPIRIDLKKLTHSDVAYVYLSVFIYVAALATGQIGYMGASVSDDHHVTPLGSLAGTLGPTLPAITVLLRKKSRILSRPVVFWALLVMQIAMLVPSGRRMIIYSAFLVVFAFTLMGDRWRSPLWKKTLVIAVCLAGMYCTNVVFYAMRYTAEQTGAAKKMGASDMSLGELVSGALRFIREGRDSHFDEDMAANLQDRTFVLPYFSDLVAGSKTHEPLYGRLIAFSVSMATPSVVYSLFGDKDKVLDLGMEEMVANPRFGIYPKDEANSLLTGGVSDFGIAGAFIYPILIALLLNFVVRVILGRVPTLIQMLVLMAYLFMLFQTEMAITGVVVNSRNLALLLIGWWIASKVVRFFLKPSTRDADESSGWRPSGATLVRYPVISRTR